MVGYNYVVRRNGTVEVGRPEDESGAHARGYNHKSIGIALVGGCTEDDVKVAENNFTSEQWESLDTLVRGLKVNYPKAKVLGHRDLEGVTKECPSFDVQSWLDDSSSVAL